MAGAPEIKAQITGDASGLQAELKKAQAGIGEFAGGVNRLAGKFGALLSGIQGPLAALAGVIGGGALMKDAINETVSWTKEAMKLSKALGITSAEASVLNLAIGDIYGNIDEFLPAMGKLTKTLASDEEAFKRLGVSTRDAQGNLRTTTEIMADVNAALLKMKAGTDRNVEGVRIYGRSWQEASKFLALTPQVMKEAQEKAEKLNLIVGADSVEATKKYRASMNDLEDTAKALKIRLGNELLPTVTDLNEAMAEAGPVTVTVFGGILKGIVQLVDGIVSGLYHAFLYATGIIRSIADVAAVVLRGTWGFLSGGLPKAKAEWKAAVGEMNGNWTMVMQEIDRSSLAQTEREMKRWGELVQFKRSKPEGGAGGHAGDGKEKDKNKWAEEMNRLQQEGLKYLQDEILATKEKAELEGILLAYEKNMEAIRDKAKAQGWSDSERAKAETQAALNAGNAWESVTKKYTLERARLEADLMAKLTAQEEGGLAQRLEAVRKTFEEIRLEAAKLGKDDGFFGIISSAEAEAKRRAFVEQVKTDMEAIKKEMAEATTTMGRALTFGEKLEILNRYSRARGTKSAAAEQYKDENHLNERGMAGLTAGLKEFAETSAMTWEDWKNQGMAGINTVTNAFAKGITGLINGTMSFRDALKSILSDITQAIIQAVAQIVAKFLVINALRFAMGMGGLGFGAFLGAASMAATALSANIASTSLQVASYRSAGSSYASGAGTLSAPISVDLRGAVIAGESAESARLIGDLVQRHLDQRNRRVG